MFIILSLFLTSGYLVYKLANIYKFKGIKGKAFEKQNNYIHVNNNKQATVTKEIRYGGRFYDVTEFIDRHPGGKIIEFYVNNDEDATLAMQQFHHRSAKKVELILKSFKSRPILVTDVGNYSKIDAKTPIKYQRMTEDFTKLYLELESEGYFKSSPLHVLYRVTELIVLGSLGLYLIHSASIPVAILGSIIMGIFLGRCGWVMHEGGHKSLTGNPKIDRLLQTVILSLGIGMSASWWRSQHNRHHAMPQRLKHDVDLNTAPFFAVNAKVIDDPKKASNFFIRNQTLLFAPIGSFFVFANWVYRLHPIYAWKKGQYLELVLMAIKFYVYECHVAAPYLLIAYVIGATKMLLNFSLSHTHTPVAEEPRHWLEYSLVHTININPSWWCDWWMGYLNYQIEHHLFPTMPQFRQRAISHRVRELAEKHGLPYVCVSYWDALKKTYQNLNDVSHEISKLGM